MQQHWSWDLAVEAICKLSFYKNIMNLFFNKKKGNEWKRFTLGGLIPSLIVKFPSVPL